MNITKATYGGVDCLPQVKSKIRGERLVLRVDNNIIGDTQVGTVKFLEIEINGELHSIREGHTFTYPKSQHNRLGVWYSNDTTNHPAVIKSLETIQIAAEGKADIVTCVWNPIQENPFHEVISWNRSSSHLNQLLQILQCIYVAKTMGKYEYVSFLEHDVLYPVGYFDYEDFGGGILTIKGGYPSYGRHQGALMSETPYTLFLDSDMFIKDNNFLNNILNEITKKQGVLLTCKVRTIDNKFNNVYKTFDVIQKLHKITGPFALGGIMLFDTNKYFKLGGFNPNDKFAEDYNLSKKVKSKDFILSENIIYTLSRRFKSKGIWFMTKLMFLSFINSC